MSIKKQIYFGIFGISFLSCINLFLLLFVICLIILSSQLFIIQKNLDVGDNNSLVGIGKLVDLISVTLIEQIKNEICLIRLILENYNNSNFYYYFDTKNYNNKFYSNNDDTHNTLLNLLSPILQKTIEIHSYSINDISLFEHFFFLQNNLIYFPYNKDENILKNINNINLEKLSSEILNRTKDTHLASFILMNFEIIDKINAEEFFLKNPALIFFKKNVESRLLSQLLNYTYAISLKINKVNHISRNIQHKKNLNNIIWLNFKTSIFNSVTKSYLNKLSNVYDLIIIDKMTNETISYEQCLFLNKLQYLYLKNENNIEISDELLYPTINKCFNNEFFLTLLSQNIDYNEIQKFQFTFINYSYNNYSESKFDYNDKIIFKSIRMNTPSKYIRKLINSNNYYSFGLIHFIFKIQNKILFYQSKLKDIFINIFIIIEFYNCIIWFVIFIIIILFVYIESNNISKPIKILIQKISSNNDINEIKLNDLDDITYKEDKDINDLFDICKKLIIGGFKHKNNYYKKNTLNIYNNISMIKTNNMIFNESEIESNKDKKYKDIFDDEENIKTNNNFEKEIYHKYNSKSLNEEIKKKVKQKFKIYDSETQLLLNSTNNLEYQLLIMAYKDIENYLPNNNLYKLYSNEFPIKKNKKINK